MMHKKFDLQKFSNYLNTAWVTKLHYFSEVNSTNIFLKDQPFLQNGELAITETQSSGRGRRGKIWKDLPFQNLLFSISYFPQKNCESLSLIPLVTAVAIAETCQLYLKNVSIKWPNDILVDGKKISGILVESKLSELENKFIIGIGLNVNQTQFDAELEYSATSFYLEKHQFFEREKILADLINCLNSYLKIFDESKPDRILEFYRKNCSTLNQMVNYELNGLMKSGFAKNILNDGSILIETESGEISFHGNEIFHIRIAGH